MPIGDIANSLDDLAGLDNKTRVCIVDFARWRHTLEAYRIDGRPVFDTSRSEDRGQLDQLQSMSASFGVGNEPQIEPCRDVLARTAGKAPVTDDNMGSEWRIPLGLE